METPRLAPTNEIIDVMAMCLAIMSIPKKNMLEVDAVAIFPGMGEKERLITAIDIWRHKGNPSFLLIAGINDQEKTFMDIGVQNLKKEGLLAWCDPVKEIHTILITKNTKEQAEWLRDKVKELEIKSLALCTSYYHMTRAYLTTLKTFLKSGLCIPIIPLIPDAPPDKESPEVGKPQWDLIPGEVDRILKYQKQGDVATKKEFQEYLRWLWQNSLIIETYTEDY